MISRWILIAGAFAVGMAGCGSPPAEFRRYDTFAHKIASSVGDDYKFTRQQRNDIDDALAALFGNPDKAFVPPVEGVNDLLQQDRLQLAAGPVGSDEMGRPRGLYREHCAHCHGVTGDGIGPTASFLNPYPRDFRPGKFKFKSTPIGQRPTRDDLKRTLLQGIPGTAMPSFALLPGPELDALIEYVQYLSNRGEVNRQLLYETAQLGDGERLIEVDTQDPAKKQEQVELLKTIAGDVVAKWNSAIEKQTPIPERPAYEGEELAASIKHGRELFYGSIANCVKCHGDTQLGDGQTTDYDEWSKEFTEGKPENFATYEALGMLPPRNAIPRNLRQGVFRGGMRPIDIFWRIRNGIEGTPMPAATIKPEGDENAKGLTEDEIWDLVNYVQQLPYEAMSNPAMDEPMNLRERS